MKDAASQLEFLKEVGSAGVGSLQAPDLLYLQGLLAWKQGQDLSQVTLSTTYILHHTCQLQQPYLTETDKFQGLNRVIYDSALPRSDLFNASWCSAVLCLIIKHNSCQTLHPC